MNERNLKTEQKHTSTIPEKILLLLRDWIVNKKYGKIILHFVEGEIRQVTMRNQ